MCFRAQLRNRQVQARTLAKKRGFWEGGREERGRRPSGREDPVSCSEKPRWQRTQKKFRAVGSKSQIKVFVLLSSKVEHLSTSVTPKNVVTVCNTQISHPSKLPACFLPQEGQGCEDQRAEEQEALCPRTAPPRFPPRFSPVGFPLLLRHLPPQLGQLFGGSRGCRPRAGSGTGGRW